MGRQSHQRAFYKKAQEMTPQEMIAAALIPEPIQMAQTYIQSRLANRDMVRHNYILGDTDDYWHRLAIAQQSRKGILPGKYALMLGMLNEAKDIARDVLGGKPFNEALNNSIKDLQRNEDGYRIGREVGWRGDLEAALEPYKNKSLRDWEQKYKGKK